MKVRSAVFLFLSISFTSCSQDGWLSDFSLRTFCCSCFSGDRAIETTSLGRRRRMSSLMSPATND